MGKVTGLGGVFYQCAEPEKTRTWYREHLGIESEAWGAMFPWNSGDNGRQEGYNVWSPMKTGSSYFKPSTSPFMLNLIVDDLVSLIHHLKEKGVPLLEEMKEDEFGKFTWILDPDGIKIELWEPAKGQAETMS